jgi:hypothetical protein
MKRLLALVGPLPFLALAILAMGLAVGVAAAVFDALAPFTQTGHAWSHYALLGVARGVAEGVAVIHVVGVRDGGGVHREDSEHPPEPGSLARVPWSGSHEEHRQERVDRAVC